MKRDKYNSEIAKNLRYYRNKCGLTQEQTANKLHIDRSTYTYYETGKNFPPLEKIIKLADIFNISYTDLLDDYNKAVLGKEEAK
ncbi:MAG: helix-turn-helix transcriptional regulator [Clostridia bacterium]|nr:helix-turn-helix transcriptional regulator [Clostridia bacterium]